ncbi:unnamed protein product, partial [Prunus brigantina]
MSYHNAAIWARSSDSIVVWSVDGSPAGMRGANAGLAPLCLPNGDPSVGRNNASYSLCSTVEIHDLCRHPLSMESQNFLNYGEFGGPFGIILESPLPVMEYIKARKELQVQQLVKEKGTSITL